MRLNKLKKKFKVRVHLRGTGPPPPLSSPFLYSTESSVEASVCQIIRQEHASAICFDNFIKLVDRHWRLTLHILIRKKQHPGKH